MSAPGFAKCSCRNCGTHLEFPVQAAGVVIACPHCQAQTDLHVPPPVETLADSGELGFEQIQAAFTAPVPRTPVSFIYQLGLMVVALAMVLLPVIYLAIIAAAGWATYWWGTHFTFLMSGSGGARVWVFKWLCYLTPLFVGAVLVFFMVKPLFARRASSAQPLALNPGAEPILFAFVTRLCQTVGAPFPARIDIDCHLNASAGFRRGALSFLGNDLVLTIGLPLVAGLNLREFAGVLAHEFGHFTQGFGMRLTYVIRSVNAWFARVVYERDQWDLTLEEWARAEDWRVAIIVGAARLAVWFSRVCLMGLMYLGHGIGCFMLRQMEYDADSYEIKLAGSDAFESTTRRMHVLGNLLQDTYKAMRTSWNLNHRLPDDFPSFLMAQDAALRPEARMRWEDTLGLEKSGVFDTHPSHGDRIRRARLADAPGVFQLDAPATRLFANFDAVARQVTLLHYADDLGLPLEMAILTSAKPDPAPDPAPAEEAAPAAPVAKNAGTPGLRLKPPG